MRSRSRVCESSSEVTCRRLAFAFASFTFSPWFLLASRASLARVLGNGDPRAIRGQISSLLKHPSPGEPCEAGWRCPGNYPSLTCLRGAPRSKLHNEVIYARSCTWKLSAFEIQLHVEVFCVRSCTLHLSTLEVARCSYIAGLWCPSGLPLLRGGRRGQLDHRESPLGVTSLP